MFALSQHKSPCSSEGHFCFCTFAPTEAPRKASSPSPAIKDDWAHLNANKPHTPFLRIPVKLTICASYSCYIHRSLEAKDLF